MSIHKLTLDEWNEIGLGLSKLNSDIIHMEGMMGKIGTCKYGDRLHNLQTPLLKIRSDLENRMLLDYPQAPLSIFFGGIGILREARKGMSMFQQVKDE
ncbi:MAG: hypothetical protein ABSH06_15345 [Thermodesulfobacteriota bacterium]|jgi:hypothetical protein